MAAAKSEIILPRAAWEGGQRNMMAAGVVGAIGVVLWFVSMSFSGGAERAGYSWLWAFLYWLTPVLGAIGWHCAFQAAKAKWIILPRRTLELLGAAVPVFVVLFIPLVIAMKSLYPWMQPEKFPEEAQRLFEHRHPWMNQGMWIGRSVIYFVVFLFVSERMLRLSLEQDGGSKPINTAGLYRLGPGALPLLGFAISFAAFDWLMSLNVTFYSSMFGLYVVAGCAMSAMACWILLNVALKTPMSGHHLHSMGKLLFAFTCFWAYTAFCQFMLIWIADIPDEIPWFHQRLFSEWRWVGYFLCVFHFALPFVILLSKELKFSPRKLSFMAIWLLIAHAVDCYWIVLPQINPEGPRFSLSDLFAFIGVGGLAIAFLIFRMRGKLLVPIGDPFIANSVEYHP
jgi:hypothetical protein